MWQLTPPYKARWYICFTANKCSHKYDLIVGMGISEKREPVWDVFYLISCTQLRAVYNWGLSNNVSVGPCNIFRFPSSKKTPIGMFHSLDPHEKMYFKVTFDFIVLTSYTWRNGTHFTTLQIIRLYQSAKTLKPQRQMTWLTQTSLGNEHKP